MERKHTAVTVYNAGGYSLSALAKDLQIQVALCENDGGWVDQVLYQDFPGNESLESMSLALVICRHPREANG